MSKEALKSLPEGHITNINGRPVRYWPKTDERPAVYEVDANMKAAGEVKNPAEGKYGDFAFAVEALKL